MDPDAARKTARKVKDLGRLHALLIRGLPDWIDDDGILMLKEIAKYVGVSPQAAYMWLARESIMPKRIAALVLLSEQSTKPFPVNQVTGEAYGPLTKGDFYEFL